MKEILVTNPADSIRYIGGKMLRPGETRLCDESQVPNDLKPKSSAEETAEDSSDQSVEQVLSQSVSTLIADVIPTASGVYLEELQAAEQAGGNRKTLVAAIGEQLLELAAKETELRDFYTLVNECKTEELTEMLESGGYDDSPAFAGVIEEELIRRGSEQ